MSPGPINNKKPAKSFIRRKPPEQESGGVAKSEGEGKEPLQLTPEMQVKDAEQPNNGAQAAATANEEQTKAQDASESAAPPAQPTDDFQTVDRSVVVGTVHRFPGGVWKQKPDGNYTSDYEVGLVKKSDRAKLEQEGVIYPELMSGVMDDAVGPEGSVEVTAVHTTENPKTFNVLKTVEIDKKLGEIDPETNAPLHENYYPALLADGEQILRADQKAVALNANVIPGGFQGVYEQSEDGRKILNKKNLHNNIAKIVGTFSGSSLAGVFNWPIISQAAPILALSSVGFTYNQNAENRANIADRKKALAEAEKKSPTDMVEMTDGEGNKYTVSARNEKIRLGSSQRQATLGRLSNLGLFGAASGTILGWGAQAGVAGLGGLAFAGAAAPFLAGGAVLLGNGSMVFESISQLSHLKEERDELLKLQKEGKTHVSRVIEGAARQISNRLQALGQEKAQLLGMLQNGETHIQRMVDDKVVNIPIESRVAELEGKINILNDKFDATTRLVTKKDKDGNEFQVPVPVNPAQGIKADGKSGAAAIGTEAAQIPIEERLKAIDKEAYIHRLKATAMSGGMVSISNLVLGLAPVTAVGAAAMAPAGLFVAGSSVKKLAELRTERKELEAAKENGEKMVNRWVALPDEDAGVKYVEDKTPISNLLADNKKEVRKNQAVLLGVGSAAATATATLGMGFSLLSVAPFAVVPLAIGAALFPDKVKEFAGKVKDIISGAVGQEGRTRRSTQKVTEEHYNSFSKRLSERLDATGLKESQPDLFEAGPSTLSRAFPNPLELLKEREYGGYYAEIDNFAKEYSQASDPEARQALMNKMQGFIEKAPSRVLPGLEILKEELANLSMEVEAQWMARGIELELKAPISEKVINNPKVTERLAELRFPTTGLKEQYRESLYQSMVTSPENIELFNKAQAGDYEAMRIYSRAGVFKAARLLAMKERELGLEMYTKVLDAIERPEDIENMDLVRKEIIYQTEKPFTEVEAAELEGAMRTLDMPIQLPAEDQQPHVNQLRASVQDMMDKSPEAAQKLLEADAQQRDKANFEGLSAQEALAERTKINAKFQAARRTLKKDAPEALKAWEESDSKLRTLATQKPVELPEPNNMTPAERRMALAFDALKKEQPKLTTIIGDSFAVINDPAYLEGLSEEQATGAKTRANLEQIKAKKQLEKKEPELFELWMNARHDVETEYIETFTDHQLKDEILSQESVTKAQEKLGFSAEQTERLFMGLMRQEKLKDSVQLDAILASETGDGNDPLKEDMLAAVKKARLEVVSLKTGGGADDNPVIRPDGPPAPLEDPAVIQVLKQNPAIGQVFNSPELAALSEQMQVPLEMVKGIYLKMLQLQKNPMMLAEFQQRLQGGDVEAANMNAIGMAVDQLLLKAMAPPPEQVEAQVTAAMDGMVGKTVLTNPEVQTRAKELGVDPAEMLKMFLTMQVTKDPSAVQALEAKAAKGEQGPTAQLTFLQEVIPFVTQVIAQLQNGQLPPGVAPAEEAA